MKKKVREMFGTMFDEMEFDESQQEDFILNLHQYHNLICEEQKKLCAKVMPGTPDIKRPGLNILNSPTVRFK